MAHAKTPKSFVNVRTWILHGPVHPDRAILYPLGVLTVRTVEVTDTAQPSRLWSDRVDSTGTRYGTATTAARGRRTVPRETVDTVLPD